MERDVERRTASGAEFARQLRRAYPMGESGMPVRLDARQSSGVRGREPTAAALKLGALVTELGGVRLADFRDRIQLVFRSQRACDGTEPVNVHDQITEPTPSGSRRRMTNESPTNASKTAVRNDPKVSVESPKTAHRPPAKLPRPKLTLAASAPQSQRVPSRPPPPPPSRAPQAQRMRLVSTDSVHEAVLSHSHVPHTPADDSFLEEKIFRSWKWSRVVTVLSVSVSVVLVAMGAAASWYRPRAAHASTAVAKHALVSSQPTPVARRPSSEPTTFANTASSPRTPLDIDSVEDLGAHEHHSRRHHVHRHRSNGGHEHRHRRHQQPASDPSVMRRVRPASQLY